MKKLKSWEYVSALGDKVRSVWRALATENDLSITIGGIKPIPQFIINSKDFLKYKTFITQEMLKEGYLSSNIVFISMAHNEKIFEQYNEKLKNIFKIIGECERGRSIDDLLETEVCHNKFKRLN